MKLNYKIELDEKIDIILYNQRILDAKLNILLDNAQAGKKLANASMFISGIFLSQLGVIEDEA